MKTSTVSKITREDKLSYVREVTVIDDGIPIDQFKVPVIDVRDGPAERGLANNMRKANNQSKYSKPSFSVIGRSYQVSHKK